MNTTDPTKLPAPIDRVSYITPRVQQEITEMRIPWGKGRIVIVIEGGGFSQELRRSTCLAVHRALVPIFQIQSPEILHGDSDPLTRMGQSMREFNTRQATGTTTPEQQIGTEIRIRRLELGWTQSELATRAGLTPTHLSRIEHGHSRGRPSTLTQIDAALRTRDQVPIGENLKG